MADCNVCINLNITESEQEDKTTPHICNYYRKRVLHKTNKPQHDSYIFPCRECVDDQYKEFVRRR